MQIDMSEEMAKAMLSSAKHAIKTGRQFNALFGDSKVVPLEPKNKVEVK